MIVPNQTNFLERTRHAKNIVFFGSGFLGDMVHSLPALWMMRQMHPQAEFRAAVAVRITPLMDCVLLAEIYPRFVQRHAEKFAGWLKPL